MYKIIRLYKFKPYLLLRQYGNQRYQNHYDVLRIPHTSSQKEIRDAFIKLTKELHPDIKGKGGHAEFVKVNEAYRVLSKEHLKYNYDMQLRHGYSANNFSNPSYSYHARYPPRDFHYYRRPSHSNLKDYEDYLNSQQNENYYGIKGVRRVHNYWICFMCVTVGTIAFVIEMFLMKSRMLNYRDAIMHRNMLLSQEYHDARERVKYRTREEQIAAFDSKLQEERNSGT